MTTLAYWHEHWAERTPRAPALQLPADDGGTGRVLTFAELCTGTAKRAARLPASLLFNEQGIAAMSGNSGELALQAAACARAGVAFFPLAAQTADLYWPQFQEQGGPLLQRLDAAPAGKAGHPRRHLRHYRDASPADLALVIATSGSEGRPKGVMLSHANLAAAATASFELLPLSPGDAWLACLPLYHIGGFSILYRCAMAGALAVVHEGFRLDAVARELQTGRITHLSLVPAMLAQLLDADIPLPPSLKAVLIGGASLSQPLLQRALAAGWPLFVSYGMTESAAQAATLRCTPDLEWEAGLVGRPLPGLHMAIGEDGRIRLRGPQMMLGYLNPALERGLGLDDGAFVSADLGRIDALGRLTVLGRADDVLVSGGLNIHPLEIESRLAACPGVRDVGISAVADPAWGDLLVAVVVGGDPQAVLEWARENLASAHRPRKVLQVDRLPRNALGKIDRTALRQVASRA